MALWLKISASIATNPKLMTAGPVAAWLWLASVGHCRINESDGFIPKMVVPGLVPGLKGAFKHASTLVAVGLWHEAPGGYQINDYLDWNPSREELEAGRTKDRARKRSDLQSETPMDSIRNPVGIQTEPSRASRGRANSTLTLGISGSEILSEKSARETKHHGTPIPVDAEFAVVMADGAPLIDGHAIRRHAQHKRCYVARGLCVTPWVWDELLGRLGGDASTQPARLGAWMDSEIAVSGTAPIGDKPDDWWRKRFAAWVGVAAMPTNHAGKGNASRDAALRAVQRLHAAPGGTIA